MKNENLLMFAAPDQHADMLYAVGVLTPEPLLYLRLRGRCLLGVPDLEVSRLRKLAPHCRVVPLGHYWQRLDPATDPATPRNQARLIREILAEQRIKKVVVPQDFPYGLARQLRRLRVKLKVTDGPFFPERAVKSAAEIKKISAAVVMAEVGLAEALQVLKNSKVGRERKLSYHNSPLTAERLRAIINTAIYQAGGWPGHTIVAAGQQACHPHEQGAGVLRAGEPIVLDVFPRSQKTGYFSDLTRTVVKGRASEALRRLHNVVVRAQEFAFHQITHGKPAREVHQALQDFFKRHGYLTHCRRGQCEGFFHGTGHGLGLELHETPRIHSRSPDILLRGHVVCVEPGLYYRELGGVRLEDVVVVTGNGVRNLTQMEKTLEV